jgi:hypothetical protein
MGKIEAAVRERAGGRAPLGHFANST